MLDKENRSSTIANFQGGYIKEEHKKRVSSDKLDNTQNIEVLIWKGAKAFNDGTEEVEIHIGTTEDVPSWAKYIIEVIYDGVATDLKFAETEQGAWIKAKRLTEEHD